MITAGSGTILSMFWSGGRESLHIEPQLRLRNWCVNSQKKASTQDAGFFWIGAPCGSKSISAPCSPRVSHSEGCSAVSQRYSSTERLSPFVLKPNQGVFNQKAAGWLCDRTHSGLATGRLAVKLVFALSQGFLNCYRSFRLKSQGAKMCPGKPNARVDAPELLALFQNNVEPTACVHALRWPHHVACHRWSTAAMDFWVVVFTQLFKWLKFQEVECRINQETPPAAAPLPILVKDKTWTKTKH